jgi:hypothetical protein
MFSGLPPPRTTQPAVWSPAMSRWSFGTAVPAAAASPSPSPPPRVAGGQGVRQGSPAGPLIASGSRQWPPPIIQIPYYREEEEESSPSPSPPSVNPSDPPAGPHSPSFDRTTEAEVVSHFLAAGNQVLEVLDAGRVAPDVREEIARLADVASAWAQRRVPVAVAAESTRMRSRVSRFHYPAPFDMASSAFENCTAMLRARAEVCNAALAGMRAAGDDVTPALRLEFYRIRAALRSHRDVGRRRRTGAATGGRGRPLGSSDAAGGSAQA